MEQNDPVAKRRKVETEPNPADEEKLAADGNKENVSPAKVGKVSDDSTINTATMSDEQSIPTFVTAGTSSSDEVYHILVKKFESMQNTLVQQVDALKKGQEALEKGQEGLQKGQEGLQKGQVGLLQKGQEGILTFQEGLQQGKQHITEAFERGKQEVMDLVSKLLSQLATIDIRALDRMTETNTRLKKDLRKAREYLERNDFVKIKNENHRLLLENDMLKKQIEFMEREIEKLKLRATKVKPFAMK